MDKFDFKKTLDFYKAKHNEFRLIDVPNIQYIAVKGHGDPNTSQDFVDAIEALYPVAYTLKFMSKLEFKKDYIVPPLEGLWWAEDMDLYTTNLDKSKWDWQLMIMTPGWITKEMFNNAKKSVKSKKNPKNLSKVELIYLEEGLCIQTLYIGPYSGEEEILSKMHSEFIPQNSLTLTKKHHEIYLSDMRKVKPEKLRTILRQPVTKL